MVLLVVDVQKMLVTEKLYQYKKIQENLKI